MCPLNDVFRIGTDGHFGTISDFKLGCLPLKAVEWSEVYSALGQVALLLDTLRKRLGIQFSGILLFPLGGYSVVKKDGVLLEVRLRRVGSLCAVN